MILWDFITYVVCFMLVCFLFFLVKLLEDTEARISWPCLGNVSWCITLSPSSLMSQAAACRHRLAGQVVGANARQLAASWNLPGSGSLGSDAYWLWDWRSTWNWDFEMLRRFKHGGFPGCLWIFLKPVSVECKGCLSLLEHGVNTA